MSKSNIGRPVWSLEKVAVCLMTRGACNADKQPVANLALVRIEAAIAAQKASK